MGDQGSSKGIPSWQLPSSSPSNAEESKPPQTPEQPATSESHDAKSATDEQSEPQVTSPSEPLVEQAKRFLDDDTLKDASIQEKIAFLKSKGLSSSEVDEALKHSKAGAATSSATTVSMSAPASTQQIDTDARSNRDVPPIITYPEFLMQAQKAPPIITVNRLLNTAYAAAGIGAAIYGLSKYLIAPMTDSLTSSRHDFAMHVQEQLDQLNEKLRGVVSSDANVGSNVRRKVAFDGNDAASDAGSSNSDPTELFHRDFGTQTSDVAPASSSSSSSSDALSDTPSDPIEEHANSLSEISNGITALINDETVAGGSSAELSTALKILDDYLESLAYPSFSSNNEMGAYGYPYNNNNNDTDKSKKKDDEILRMKAEIRGVKGVLLSARNFPGSTGGRRPLYPPTTT